MKNLIDYRPKSQFSPEFVASIENNLDPLNLRYLHRIADCCVKIMPRICNKDDIVVGLRSVDLDTLFQIGSVLVLCNSVLNKEVSNEP